MDGSGSGMTLRTVNTNHMLVHLTLAGSSVLSWPFTDLSNLQHLDLSNNHITNVNVTVIARLGNLKFLSLSNNPLQDIYGGFSTDLRQMSLTTVDLSGM
jgi:Leucine-rich repeat (LRR) protein